MPRYLKMTNAEEAGTLELERVYWVRTAAARRHSISLLVPARRLGLSRRRWREPESACVCSLAAVCWDVLRDATHGCLARVRVSLMA